MNKLMRILQEDSPSIRDWKTWAEPNYDEGLFAIRVREVMLFFHVREFIYQRRIDEDHLINVNIIGLLSEGSVRNMHMVFLQKKDEEHPALIKMSLSSSPYNSQILQRADGRYHGISYLKHQQ
jgi:hypothetical protein